jgi:hypothetical protein
VNQPRRSPAPEPCAHFVDLAVEAALGIAEEPEANAAAEHLAGCAACRRLVAELTTVADELALAAPPVAPPEGFAERTLTAIADDRIKDRGAAASPAVLRRRRRRPVAAVVAVAAALLLVAGAAAVVGRTRGATAAVQTAAFVDPADREVGRAVISTEGRPWLLVTLDGDAPAGTYRVICRYEDQDWPMGSVVNPSPPNPGPRPERSEPGAAFAALLPFAPDEPVGVRLEPVGEGVELHASLG